MANTIRDAKTAALGAMMDINKVIQDFAAEWNAPDMRRVEAVAGKNILDQWDANMPDIEVLGKDNPDVFNKASQQIQELRNRFNGVGNIPNTNIQSQGV